MNILVLKSTFFPIKSSYHVRRILQEARRQNAAIEFSTDDSNISFVVDSTNDEFIFRQSSFNSTTPVKFQPCTVLSMDEAIKELYSKRKYFNRKWRGE